MVSFGTKFEHKKTKLKYNVDFTERQGNFTDYDFH